jgi:hypothetical protein
MSSAFYPEITKLLLASPPAEVSALLRTLATVLRNALDKGGQESDGEKYRTLKASNATIRSRVLESSGGIPLLYAVGFEKKSDGITTLYQVLHRNHIGMPTR